MSNKDKPFYKKKIWWIALAGIIMVFYFIGVMTEDEQADEPELEDKEKNEKEEEDSKEEKEIEEEPEELNEKIAIDKTIELNDATIVIQSLKVTGDETQLYGYWNHNSQYDEAHIELLVTTTFKQHDEEIEILNHDTLLKQKKKMIDGSFDIKLERVDNSPIEITFTANTDERDQEKITVDIP